MEPVNVERDDLIVLFDFPGSEDNGDLQNIEFSRLNNSSLVLRALHLYWENNLPWRELDVEEGSLLVLAFNTHGSRIAVAQLKRCRDRQWLFKNVAGPEVVRREAKVDVGLARGP